MAKELKIEPNCAPDPDLPEALKLFPRRLVLLGNQRDLNRQEIAELAERNASQVGRWLAYKQLEHLAASVIIRLELAFRLAPGSLLNPSPVELVQAQRAIDPMAAAQSMGLEATVLAAAIDGSGAALLSEFRDPLRRAIVGACHLYRLPLEIVLPAAKQARDRVVNGADLEPDEWLILMRAFLPHADKRGQSGTYPSSGSIKLT